MKQLFLAVLIICSVTAAAQTDTLPPPYKRYPTVPPLQLVLEDSATKYTKADLPKKKPVLIMMFSPDCDHCQHEAEQLVANAEKLKDIQLVMITTAPIYRMTEFANKYGLTGLKNVVVAKDPYYLLPPFFDMRNYPFLALYNKKGELIRVFEGSVSVEKLLATFEGK
jgi:thiol-disulfide isomerase/thioredoxin